MRFLIAFTAILMLAAPAAAQAGMLTTTGTQADVSVPDSPALVPSTGYTVEAWFYYNPAAPGGGSSPTILRKNTDSPPSYLLRVTNTSGGNLQYYANATGSYVSVTSSVPTPINSWHHIAGTHDGQVARLFLDGVQVGQAPCVGSPWYVSGNLEISKGDPYNESWHGSIDEVRLWSVAKTASQIQADMMFERDNVPNLVAAWHFNGNYSDTTGGHHGLPNAQVTIQPSTSPVLGDELIAPPLSPIGAPLPFTIKSVAPSTPYILDVSVTGNSPGIYIPPPVNKTLPLNEPLLYLTYGSFLDPYFSNFFGFTGANNLATAALNVPALQSLVGNSIWASYVTLDPASPFGILHVGNGTVTVLTGPAPVVASVTPGTSPVAGGVTVVIQGSNFATGATVLIGTASAVNVVVINANTITCTTPALPIGPKPVKVTNPDTMFGVLQNGITYVANLVITSIAPPYANPGQTVTISGAGFVTGLGLTVAGVPVTPTSVAPGVVTFAAPATVPCDALVVVTNPDAQTQSISWNAAPAISSAVSASGPASGGGTFFILGQNFYAGTTVTIGGAPATVLLPSLTNLFVQAPPGTPGPATIVVTSPNGCTDTATYTYQ